MKEPAKFYPRDPKDTNEKTFLSKEAVQQLQSNLITSSLLSFQEQLETERRLAAEQSERERQIELDKQRFEEERTRKRQEQQRLENKNKKKETTVFTTTVELEAQHKKQLQSIIESRYARFEASKPKSVEEEEESFTTIEDPNVQLQNFNNYRHLHSNKHYKHLLMSKPQENLQKSKPKENKKN